MSAPTAIIAEDEPLIRREIRNTLAELWPSLRILDEVGDGKAALASIESRVPDVVFLDIQMPGLNGLDVAQRLRGPCARGVITAFDKYAVSAFQQGALAYILKPISAPPASGHRAVARAPPQCAGRPQPHRRSAEGDSPSRCCSSTAGMTSTSRC